MSAPKGTTAPGEATEIAEEPRAAVADQDTFVTRLPILNRKRKVFAYQLLFRPLGLSANQFVAPDQTSARVISDAVLSIGLEALTGGRRAFVPVTRRLLLEGVPNVLPPAQVVLELATDIEADGEVVAMCQELREAGYAIAVDDFVLNQWTRDLIPLADFIKVDFRTVTDSGARQEIAGCRQGKRPELIAGGVETVETFDAALAEGFSYFQGFFFGRPALNQARSVPSQQVGNLRLLKALHDESVGVHQLEEMVKRDAGLVYRILRTVNSAAFAQQRKIESIRHALILLGRNTVRRWAAVWAFAGSGGSTQSELVRIATVRGRCCELLAGSAGDDAAAEGFLVGLCSLLDALLECPLEAVLDQLPLSDEAVAALRGEDNQQRRWLDCIIAYESGDWDQALEAADRAGIDPGRLRKVHVEALQWVHDVTATEHGH